MDLSAVSAESAANHAVVNAVLIAAAARVASLEKRIESSKRVRKRWTSQLI